MTAPLQRPVHDCAAGTAVEILRPVLSRRRLEHRLRYPQRPRPPSRAAREGVTSGNQAVMSTPRRRLMRALSVPRASARNPSYLTSKAHPGLLNGRLASPASMGDRGRRRLAPTRDTYLTLIAFAISSCWHLDNPAHCRVAPRPIARTVQLQGSTQGRVSPAPPAVFPNHPGSVQSDGRAYSRRPTNVAS